MLPTKNFAVISGWNATIVISRALCFIMESFSLNRSPYLYKEGYNNVHSDFVRDKATFCAVFGLFFFLEVVSSFIRGFKQLFFRISKPIQDL